jgi:hypothetical protein
MRTIAINPTKRKKNMATRRKTRKAPARRRTTARRSNPAPARRRKRANPMQATIRKLAAAAVGGAAAGALVNVLDRNKPQFLAAVPSAGVPIIAGALLSQYGKGAHMKDVAAGMVAYGAGELASQFTGPSAPSAPAIAPPAGAGVGALVMTNPGHYHSNPGHYMSNNAHVGNLLVTVKE